MPKCGINRQPLTHESLFCSSLFTKQCVLVLGKGCEKYHSKDSAGNNLSGTYSKHHKWNRKIDGIAVTKYEGYQNSVGYDWWNWCQPFAAVTKFVSKYSSDKGGNTSKCNIQRNGTAKQVGEDTADKKSGNGSWCEEWSGLRKFEPGSLHS